MKEIKFTDPMYEADIVYLIGGDVEDLIKIIEERHGQSPKYSWGNKFEWGEDANTTDAYQFHINAKLGDGETFYIWMHKPKYSLLFHETLHLVGDILYTRGISYTYESEEAFAYLGGWIFNELCNKLQLQPIILK